jgi:hypothetical protein
VALPVLAATASAIGNARRIYLKRGWVEAAIIWTGIVGESGTLKSPAYKKAIARLFQIQKQRIEEHKQNMATYKMQMKEYLKGQKNHTDADDEPELPILKRVIVSNTTIEKLAEVLDDNPRGVLVARDELAGWLSSFSRYKGGQGGSDLHNWLELSQAGTIIVDRKTGEKVTRMISPASVSVTGGIQPGVLARALTPEFLDAGLGARLLLAMPTPPRKRWSDAEVDEDVEKAYHNLLDGLLKLDFNTARDEDGPHILHLSPEAKVAWIDFYNSWAQEQSTTEGELAAAFSKLEGFAARFALLHHVVTHVALGKDDRVPIKQASVHKGELLAILRGTPATAGDPATRAAARPPLGVVTISGKPFTYIRRWSDEVLQPADGHLAIDTETEPIPDDPAAPPPRLALASVSDGETHALIHPDDLGRFLLAHRGLRFVCHNAAFDFWTIEQHFRQRGEEEARAAWWNIADDGRLHDSMILDGLVRLAKDDTFPRPFRLDVVAREYANLEVDKEDPHRRRYGEIIGADWTTIEEGFFSYAIADAVVTHPTHAELRRRAAALAQRHAGKEVWPDADQRFGLLTETLQVRKALALAGIERAGMTIDRGQVQAGEED